MPFMVMVGVLRNAAVEFRGRHVQRLSGRSAGIYLRTFPRGKVTKRLITLSILGCGFDFDQGGVYFSKLTSIPEQRRSAMSHRKVLSALTLILALAAAPVLAEEQHHSAGAPPAATTAQAMPGMGQGTQGGMGQGGMQGMGMMGMPEGGMRNMPMMGMPGSGTQQGGMPMMAMMCNMMRQGGMGGMPMGGMPTMADHTEGRIAFLKTELKITDAQLPLWNAVADAIRASAKSGMDNMGQGSLTERLAAREKALAAQAESLRKFKSAVDPLYAALSDEQKKTADELLMSPMGMM
ncbi:MAG: Spy/CpxP family protein refolding chaperone [Rhizobiaceae bacterium]